MAQICYTPESKTGKLKIVAGEVAFDASNPTPVDLSKFFRTAVVAVVAAIKSAVAPADNTAVVTYGISGKVVNFYAWTNTGGTDPTLTASTGTETISYVAVGY